MANQRACFQNIILTLKLLTNNYTITNLPGSSVVNVAHPLITFNGVNKVMSFQSDPGVLREERSR